MRRILLLAFLLTTFVFAQQQTDIPWPTLANSDWPMIKHDPQFTGRSSYKGPQSPTIVWTRDMNNGIFSGPVIGVDNNLYFGCYFQDYYHQGLSDFFYCYSPDGDSLWRYELGLNRPPQSGILIDSSNTVYFGSLDQNVYALNPDGTLKWRCDTGWPIVEMAMPNIDLQGNIYVTNGGGELVSINHKGTINWKVNYEGGFFNKSPALSPDGNTVYIFGKDSNLFAIKLDGSIKWEYSFVGSDKGILIDSEGNLYFDGGYNLVCLDSNAVVRWIYNDYTMGTHSMSTIDRNGNIYSIAHHIGSTGVENYLVALDYYGNFKWSYRFDLIQSDDFWQPLICDNEGTVYVGSTEGNYYYAISSDGQLKWKLALDGNQVDNTSAIAKDGTLYLGVHITSLNNQQQKTLIAIKDTGGVGINQEDITITDFKLEQNFPNPFNPTTTINYQLPRSGYVALNVYDILGKEVSSLVNEQKNPGRYSVNFGASQLAAGVYIYQLRVNDYVSSRKMLLIK